MYAGCPGDFHKPQIDFHMKNTILGLIILCLGQILQGQQVAKSESGTFLLTNATIHTITNGTIVNGHVLISNGMISEVGSNVVAPSGVRTIDCTGQHIYPGFIDGGTQVGLIEVNSVSLTNDHNEIGDLIPHMQAMTAVNPNAVAIPVTRANGITTALVVPSGKTFPGTAALMNLHGYTPKQMFAGFKGIVMNFPSTGKRGRRDSRSEEDIKKEQEKATKKINEIWDKVALYARIDSTTRAMGKSHDNYQPEMEALLPVYRGTATLLIAVNKDKDIETAIAWIQSKKVKAVLTGVAEGWRVADKIAEAGIPVITGPVLSLPGRQEDRYDTAYKNAALMQKAGVKVALRTNDSENVRNLPFNAGFAAAYGMGIENALKAITIVPAEIFGVADKLGSIEKGKIANLFVSTGDPFEMKTRIVHLFIKGWKVPLESRHTLLYDEFLHRTPGLDR